MNVNPANPYAVVRWAICCHFANVGISWACIGARAAYLGHTGWLGILTAIPIFLFFGFGIAYLGLGLLMRVLSLSMYLRVYGFSGTGLTADSPKQDSPKIDLPTK